MRILIGSAEQYLCLLTRQATGLLVQQPDMLEYRRLFVAQAIQDEILLCCCRTSFRVFCFYLDAVTSGFQFPEYISIYLLTGGEISAGNLFPDFVIYEFIIGICFLVLILQFVYCVSTI